MFDEFSLLDKIEKLSIDLGRSLERNHVLAEDLADLKSDHTSPTTPVRVSPAVVADLVACFTSYRSGWDPPGFGNQG